MHNGNSTFTAAGYAVFGSGAGGGQQDEKEATT